MTSSRLPWYRPRWFWLPLLVILIGGGLQIRAAWQDSLTNDEVTHIAAGVSYWRTGDFRLNDPHPSLFKLWAALPLLPFPHLNLDTSSAAWKTADQWTIGEQFIYHSSSDVGYARWIVFAARLPMILLWAAIGWMLYAWSVRHWNAWGGLITLSAYTFDPNFLGHGHLVNNDVPLAGAFFLSIWAAERLFARPTWRRTWIVSCCAALTLLMKFSGIFVYPVIGAMALFFAWRRTNGYSWRWLGRLALTGAISFLALTWIAYGGSIGRPFNFSVSHDISAHKYLQAGIAVLSKVPVPAPHFYTGLRDVFLHNAGGHPAYLLGHVSSNGWWYYFPVAVAVKTPLLTLATFLAVIGLAAWFHRRTTSNWHLVSLYTIPPLLFFAWSLTSHLNIGLRHVFIIYPFLFAALGSIGTLPLRGRPYLAGVLCLGWLSVALITGPHTIAYFNAAVDGTAHGQTLLRDSNLDWQQDVWRLRDDLATHDVIAPHLDINAATDMPLFVPDAQPVETDQQIAAGAVPHGTYAVSVRWLFDNSQHLTWLRTKIPARIVGSTIWVYHF